MDEWTPFLSKTNTPEHLQLTLPSCLDLKQKSIKLNHHCYCRTMPAMINSTLSLRSLSLALIVELDNDIQIVYCASTGIMHSLNEDAMIAFSYTQLYILAIAVKYMNETDKSLTSVKNLKIKWKLDYGVHTMQIPTSSNIMANSGPISANYTCASLGRRRNALQDELVFFS